MGRRLWRNLNWKIIILVFFACFFQSISSSMRSQSLYHFVWEALGFSLFVATRFLYVKLLGFFVFWKASAKDSTSKKNIICHFTKHDCFGMPMSSSVANVWLSYIWIFTAHMITLKNYLLKFTLTIWILKITGNKGLSSSENKKNINKINRRSHDKSVMTGSACKHVKGAR